MTTTAAALTSAPRTRAHEYRLVRTTARSKVAMRDLFLAFGWRLEADSGSQTSDAPTTLAFSRDREIQDRPRAIRAQRDAEDLLHEILRLQASPAAWARGAGIVSAALGCALFAAAAFGFLAGSLPFFICCSIFGMTGCVITPLIRGPVRAAREHHLAPRLQHHQDALETSNRIVVALL